LPAALVVSGKKVQVTKIAAVLVKVFPGLGAWGCYGRMRRGCWDRSTTYLQVHARLGKAVPAG
jgi:hypothetical protein